MLRFAPFSSPVTRRAARAFAAAGLPTGIMLALAGPAVAQEDLERVITTLRACATIEAMEARVRCYDANVHPRASAAAVPAAPPVASSPASTGRSAAAGGPATPPAGFGHEMVRQTRVIPRPAPESALRAEVSEVERLQPGIWLLTLADGAQWRFVDAAPLSYAAPRAGETVELERGTLGSVFLAYEGQKRLRVTRIR